MLVITLTDEQYEDVTALVKSAINTEYERAKYRYRSEEAIDGWDYVSRMSGVMVEFCKAKEAVDAIP